MSKILVEVYLPAMNRMLELRIPLSLKVDDVINMICSYLQKMDISEYVPSEDTVLCDSSTGKILDRNKFINDVELTNGSRIFMV